MLETPKGQGTPRKESNTIESLGNGMVSNDMDMTVLGKKGPCGRLLRKRKVRILGM